MRLRHAGSKYKCWCTSKLVIHIPTGENVHLDRELFSWCLTAEDDVTAKPLRIAQDGQRSQTTGRPKLESLRDGCASRVLPIDRALSFSPEGDLLLPFLRCHAQTTQTFPSLTSLHYLSLWPLCSHLPGVYPAPCLLDHMQPHFPTLVLPVLYPLSYQLLSPSLIQNGHMQPLWPGTACMAQLPDRPAPDLLVAIMTCP